MTHRPTVQLFYVAGCPNVEAARILIRTCRERLAFEIAFEEYEGDYPSPTIRVDGVDVMGEAEEISGRACRLELPTEARLMAALNRPPGKRSDQVR